MTWRIALLGASLLALGACSGGTVKESLGLTRKAPDEFRVVSRPPLSVPPQFNLRPPANAADARTIGAANEAQSLVRGEPVANESGTYRLPPADTATLPVTAQELVTGKEKKPAASSAESRLLEKAGAHTADPSVKRTLEEERLVVQEPEEEPGWWDSLTNASKKEPMVDAKAEAERIRSNKDAGKPITEGETPQVGAKDTGVLGTIFGY